MEDRQHVSSHSFDYDSEPEGSVVSKTRGKLGKRIVLALVLMLGAYLTYLEMFIRFTS